jgi:hypothetical protein
LANSYPPHYFLGMVFSVVGALARVIAPVAAVAALVAQVPTQLPATPAVRLVDESNPLAGKPFYVDPISLAMRAAKSTGSPELTTIANTPSSFWIDQAFSAGSVAGTVARYTGAAQAAGAMPVLTLYAIPNRDCGSFAAGGFSSGAEYRQWIDGVASGLGSAPAAIILEPDALAMADCLSAGQRQERFDLMKYAVDTLTTHTSAVHGGSASTPRTSTPPKRKSVSARRSRASPMVRTMLSTPPATAWGRRPTARSTGATRPGERLGSHPPRPPRASTPMPTCGSSGQGNPMDPAIAANPRPAGSSTSTPSN